MASAAYAEILQQKGRIIFDMYENTAVAVLTLNPGDMWQAWIHAYNDQVIRPDCYVIDSNSDDATVGASLNAGLSVYTIDRLSFNHGGTRNYALRLCGDYEYVIYMTQDAVLANKESIKSILEPFGDDAVAAVCGRQLPRPGAGALESHARLFNYPDQSRVSSVGDAKRLGLKTAFLSNSFAAYRVSALKDVGGFPQDVIFGEDMCISAKLLKAGHKVAYAADACVYHSHDYTLIEEFRRYFDMGVFHAREPWIRRDFGAAESEGLKYVVSEMGYLSRHAFWRIPEALLRTVLKYTGFRLGRAEHYIPLNIKRIMSMNSGYFKTD